VTADPVLETCIGRAPPDHAIRVDAVHWRGEITPDEVERIRI
jgi:hypothetical protein